MVYVLDKINRVAWLCADVDEENMTYAAVRDVNNEIAGDVCDTTPKDYAVFTASKPALHAYYSGRVADTVLIGTFNANVATHNYEILDELPGPIAHRIPLDNRDAVHLLVCMSGTATWLVRRQYNNTSYVGVLLWKIPESRRYS